MRVLWLGYNKRRDVIPVFLLVFCGLMGYLTITLVDLVVPLEYFITTMFRPVFRPL